MMSILQAVIIFLAIMYEPLSLDGYTYPDWGQAIGWAVVFICVLPIPIVFLIQFCRMGGVKVSQ